MKIKVYKSLYKPPVIAGISRKAFGSLLMATFMSVAVFRSPEALLPVIVIYFILRWCMKKDNHLLNILQRNLRLKDAYTKD